MNNFFRCIVATCTDFCTKELFATQLSLNQYQKSGAFHLARKNYEPDQRYEFVRKSKRKQILQTGKQQEANENQVKDAVYLAKSQIPNQREPRFLRFQIGMKLSEIERIVLIEMIKEYKGNKKMLAKLLGVSEKTIYNKIIMYNLHRSFTRL